jgi:hypothetical protein
MPSVSAAHSSKDQPDACNPHRFRELEINPNMYLLNWLMALYTKSLPLDLVRSCLLASTLRHATDPIRVHADRALVPSPCPYGARGYATAA